MTGPQLVRSADQKSVFVYLGELTGARQFNLSMVKPAMLPYIQRLISPTTPPPSNTEVQPPVLQRQINIPMAFFTEIIEHRDTHTGMFEEDNRKEIQGIIYRGTFRMALRSDAGESPKIILSRLVLSIKQKKNEPYIYNARFLCVVGGHRDRAFCHVVQNATMLKQSWLKILIALASILGFHMYSIDVF